MGFYIKSDRARVSTVILSGKCTEVHCNSVPLILGSRIEADLLASFLACRFPAAGPYSVHETVKVLPVEKEV